MAEQWLRSFELELGASNPLGGGGVKLEATDKGTLRCAFRIERDEKPWPNTAEIAVWNLNEAHRDYLESQSAVACRLTAGYRDNTGGIFFGALRTARTEREGPDLVTRLSAADGESGKDKKPITTARVRKTWSKGTPLAVVVTQMGEALQVEVGNLPALAPTALLPNGPILPFALSVDGPVLDEFTDIMRSVGIAWSIQDGALQLRAAEVPAGFVPLLSPMTGLVGSPRLSTEQDKDGNEFTQVNGRCLLLPGLVPGYQVVLQSDTATGLYLCTKVVHVGDTHTTEWYTEFEAR